MLSGSGSHYFYPTQSHSTDWLLCCFLVPFFAVTAVLTKILTNFVDLRCPLPYAGLSDLTVYLEKIHFFYPFQFWPGEFHIVYGVAKSWTQLRDFH